VEKLLVPTQNSTEIGQSAADLWPKTIFSMTAVRHLEILKFIFSHVTVIEVPICCCVPDFIEIGLFHVQIWRFHDFRDGKSPLASILWVQ